MVNLGKVPADCSVEKLFPQWEELFQSAEPLGHAKQYVGGMGYLEIPIWGTTLDPCEDNIRRSDGIIEHDNFICLCKWGEEPITVRYSVVDVFNEAPYNKRSNRDNN